MGDAGGGVDAGPGVDTGMPPPPVDSGITPPPPGMFVDPACTDGMYTEALPNPAADISDLVAAYSPAAATTYVLDVLSRRYPFASGLVAQGRMSGIGDCVEAFLRDTSSPSAVNRQLSTLVHECGHFVDIDMGGTYVINDSLTLSCSGGRATSQGGNTIARSLMNDDDYSSMRPPCGGGRGGCDSYADVYLDGDPTNGTFEGGDQGFASVIEEATQYVNSIATGYAFNNELMGGFVSERDGILTFLWWIMRYLRHTRLNYPSAYAFISGDPCWREAILTVWGRAWLFLGLTEDMSWLGIDDDTLLGLVGDATLLQEIQMIRDADGC